MSTKFPNSEWQPVDKQTAARQVLVFRSESLRARLTRGTLLNFNTRGAGTMMLSKIYPVILLFITCIDNISIFLKLLQNTNYTKIHCFPNYNILKSDDKYT